MSSAVSDGANPDTWRAYYDHLDRVTITLGNREARERQEMHKLAYVIMTIAIIVIGAYWFIDSRKI